MDVKAPLKQVLLFLRNNISDEDSFISIVRISQINRIMRLTVNNMNFYRQVKELKDSLEQEHQNVNSEILNDYELMDACIFSGFFDSAIQDLALLSISIDNNLIFESIAARGPSYVAERKIVYHERILNFQAEFVYPLFDALKKAKNEIRFSHIKKMIMNRLYYHQDDEDVIDTVIRSELFCPKELIKHMLRFTSYESNQNVFNRLFEEVKDEAIEFHMEILEYLISKNLDQHTFIVLDGIQDRLDVEHVQELMSLSLNDNTANHLHDIIQFYF